MTDAKSKFNKLNSMVIYAQKGCFVVYIASQCPHVAQFNDSLRSQFNGGKEYQGIRAVKAFDV